MRTSSGPPRNPGISTDCSRRRRKQAAPVWVSLSTVIFLLAALVACGGSDGSASTSAFEDNRSSAPEATPSSGASVASPSDSAPEAAPPSGASVASPSDSLRFAVKGDFGSGSSEQASITEQMCALRNSAGFTFVVTTGDNFYDPDGTATDSNYYGPEKCLYSDARHEWRASWGNHDAKGGSTGDVLGAPTDPRYYTWTAGNAAFFAYNGNKVDDAQREWLRDAVCSSSAKVKIIYGHQPPFSVGKHGSDADVQNMVRPVAQECDVSLVLSGHDHLYERNHPIDGVTYIVTGGGGRSLYDCER